MCLNLNNFYLLQVSFNSCLSLSITFSEAVQSFILLLLVVSSSQDGSQWWQPLESHVLVWPSDLNRGVGLVTCSYWMECGKSDGISFLKLDHKKASIFPSCLAHSGWSQPQIFKLPYRESNARTREKSLANSQHEIKGLSPIAGRNWILPTAVWMSLETNPPLA